MARPVEFMSYCISAGASPWGGSRKVICPSLQFTFLRGGSPPNQARQASA